jgi:hypothetical protein
MAFLKYLLFFNDYSGISADFNPGLSLTGPKLAQK